MTHVASSPVHAFHSAPLHAAIADGIAYCGKQQVPGGVFFIAIKNLDWVLAAFGAEAADQVMTELATQLRAVLKPHDQVLRTGYAEFALVLLDYQKADIDECAPLLIRTIRNYECKDFPVHLVCALASSGFTAADQQPGTIIDRTFVALQEAKASDYVNYCAYNVTDKRKQQLKDTMQRAHYLYTAIRHQKLRLAFQPIVEAATGNIYCHECLLRMIKEDGTVASAGPFIPVSEQLFFVDDVDLTVLEMVIREIQSSPEVVLSFNVSSQTINNPLWLQRAEKLLQDPQIASRIIVEMTETSIADDVKRAMHFVTSLQALGCRVALDDFGAGYTSFRQLKDLPVDIIKIDGTYIRDIATNPDSRLFVKTLMEFIHGFGLKAVAEFVETGEIAKILMELQVDYFQGNYFHPAMNQRKWDIMPS